MVRQANPARERSGSGGIRRGFPVLVLEILRFVGDAAGAHAGRGVGVLRRKWDEVGSDLRKDFQRIILNRREQGTIASVVLVSLVVMFASTVRWPDDVRYVGWDQLIPSPLVHAVDLNLASRGELESLPGVGPALADRIVREREERGRFHEVNDLRRVRGIGPKTMERLRPWIGVEAELER